MSHKRDKLNSHLYAILHFSDKQRPKTTQLNQPKIKKLNELLINFAQTLGLNGREATDDINDLLKNGIDSCLAQISDLERFEEPLTHLMTILTAEYEKVCDAMPYSYSQYDEEIIACFVRFKRVYEFIALWQKTYYTQHLRTLDNQLQSACKTIKARVDYLLRERTPLFQTPSAKEQADAATFQTLHDDLIKLSESIKQRLRLCKTDRVGQSTRSIQKGEFNRYWQQYNAIMDTSQRQTIVEPNKKLLTRIITMINTLFSALFKKSNKQSLPSDTPISLFVPQKTSEVLGSDPRQILPPIDLKQ